MKPAQRCQVDLKIILGIVGSYVLVFAAASLALGLIVVVFFRKPRSDRNWLPGLDRVATFVERADNKVLARNLRDWTFDQNGLVTKVWRDVLIDPETAISVWYFRRNCSLNEAEFCSAKISDKLVFAH